MRVSNVILLATAVVAMTMFAGVASAAQPSDSQTLLPPPWILPLAPPGYGGAGVVNPYSNVNPLNPMAAEMQKAAQGETTTTPAAQPTAGTDAVAPAATADPAAAAPATFVELDAETEDLPDNVMMAPYPLIPAPSFAPVTVDTAALQAATYSFREALPQGADALPRNQRGELECLGCEWKQ